MGFMHFFYKNFQVIFIWVSPFHSCFSSCETFFCFDLFFQVSVPRSSLFDIVTVRCGHCTNLWSVNMAAALQSLSWQGIQVKTHSKL